MKATDGTVVPQRRWRPADEVDVRRHVESADLELPIFFINRNGSIGFPLLHILQGCDRDLRNANAFASLAGKTTTHIRINVGLSLVGGNHNLTHAKLSGQVIGIGNARYPLVMKLTHGIRSP